jgi:uncharacterized protein YbjQ (UPF0145 family)
VRTRGLGGNFVAQLRTILGGEVKEYTQLLEDARRQAIDRMVRNASVMGANAVLCMRFGSTEMGQSMTEIVAYGTAAILAEAKATGSVWNHGGITTPGDSA